MILSQRAAATLRSRSVALFIDQLFVFLILIGFTVFFGEHTHSFTQQDGTMVSHRTESKVGWLFSYPAYPFLIAGMWFLYECILGFSPLKATFGKLVLDLKIINSNGNDLSPKARVFRNMIKALFGPLSYFFALFRKDKRCLHDLMCNTIVVNYSLFKELHRLEEIGH